VIMARSDMNKTGAAAWFFCASHLSAALAICIGIHGASITRGIALGAARFQRVHRGALRQRSDGVERQGAEGTETSACEKRRR